MDDLYIKRKLKDGVIFEISKRGYSPAKLKLENDKIYSIHNMFGKEWYWRQNITLDEVAKHIENLYNENFKIKEIFYSKTLDTTFISTFQKR